MCDNAEDDCHTGLCRLYVTYIYISIDVSHGLEVRAAEFAKVLKGRNGEIATAC
jgi:hypothetical protein